MKPISRSAIATLMVATLGLSALPALAQEAAPAPTPPAATEAQPDVPAPPPASGRDGPQERGPRHGGPGPDLLSFERGAEAIEIALVRLSYRLDLTSEQQALLDTLKTTALSAVADFEAAVEPLRPAPQGTATDTTATEGTGTDTAQRPDMAQMLETRIAIDTARLDALKAVQPDFVAFFDSLTDAQKAELQPEPGMRGDRGDRGGPRGGHGWHEHDQRPGGMNRR